MIKLETARLTILALDAEQMQLAMDAPTQLEQSLGLQVTSRVPSGELRTAMGIMIDQMRADPQNWFWYSFWQIVLTAEHRIIGGIDYKGPPGDTGCIEVGYELDREYQGHGYMTESLAAFLDWGLAHPGVHTVQARTYPWNVRSHRVLQRAGFRCVEPTEPMWRWELDRGDWLQNRKVGR